MKVTSGQKCSQQSAAIERAEGLRGGRLYSAKEVSEVIRLNERTITGYAENGEIGHYAMGARKQFSKADVVDYLKWTYRPANARCNGQGGNAEDERDHWEVVWGGTGEEAK